MKTSIITMIIAAVLLVGGAAVAQTSGVISACVGRDGSLRIAQECRSNETVLTWNQQGPAGPQGPEGPQGPAGPAGPAANYRFVKQSDPGTHGIIPNDSRVMNWECHGGHQPVSAGVERISGPNFAIDKLSVTTWPTTAADGVTVDKWWWRIVNESTDVVHVRLSLVCAQPVSAE